MNIDIILPRNTKKIINSLKNLKLLYKLDFVWQEALNKQIREIYELSFSEYLLNKKIKYNLI